MGKGITYPGPIGAKLESAPIGPVEILKDKEEFFELIKDRIGHMAKNNIFLIERHKEILESLFEQSWDLKESLQKENDIAIIDSFCSKLGT